MLAELHQESLLDGLSFEDFVRRSAYYFVELNYIHPLREGNERAAREFMRLLFDRNGYEVKRDAVETDHLLAAMEASVFDTAELKRVPALCLSSKELSKRQIHPQMAA